MSTIAEELVDVEVKVTEEDIRYGERDSMSRCPVNLALSRVFPTWRVLTFISRFNLGGTIIDLPPSVINFNRAFDDSTVIFVPFTFTITVPKRFTKETGLYESRIRNTEG
jgi:hypothetical protein